MHNPANTSNQSSNKRLAKNTLFLYFRMLLLMGVGLYTSRVVLATLGISDYGLYNVVGGVVSIFGFLNATLATSTQRFLNFELGSASDCKVKQVFSTALFLHLILVIVILLLSETIGLWFVLSKLNVESGREFAALCVYQTSVLVTIVQIVQLPFMSSIIAHERMGFYAYLSILEACLKLGIVFILQYTSFDKLILYSILYFFVQSSICCVYILYSYTTFNEVSFRLLYKRELFNRMLSFSGWNIFGGFACICNNQGVNVVLNMFCGSIVNAARGIAFQVNVMVNQLVSNFQLAVKPQVVKYFAIGEFQKMTDLVFMCSKFSAFLMIIVVVPFVVEIETVLRLWLGEFPSYAPVFLALVLIRSIISSMTGSVLMVVHASGKVREVSLFSGFCYFIVLPISYILLYLDYSPTIIFIVDFFSAFADTFFELFWMKKHINFPMKHFYIKVYGVVFPILVVCFLAAYALHVLFFHYHVYLRLFIVSFLSIVFSLLVIYFFGIGKSFRSILNNKISAFINS